MRFKNLRVVVISGLSGAGRSSALKCFEDLGFFCIDNLPPQLLPKLVELCTQSGSEISKIALGIDIRERGFFRDFENVLNDLIKSGYPIEIAYLDARDEALVRRFSETRRPHPLAKEMPVIDGIRLERERLRWLREKATLIIDTSDFNIHQLKNEIYRHFFEAERDKKIIVNIVSFGFKYGVPYDIDMLFDIRFLPNPNFVSHLKPLSGGDKDVSEYLLSSPQTKLFLERFFQFVDFLMSQYEQEGRYYLSIGIGCTGGRHRSVFIAESLERHIRDMGYETTLRHRDIEKVNV
ncbi:MAG: RNase adapter RapZ [Nitrospirae bacterium]|nr:RNase adapter RapZ [Nitrospirota bacterium]